MVCYGMGERSVGVAGMGAAGICSEQGRRDSPP
jgi:hypothetical protein